MYLSRVGCGGGRGGGRAPRQGGGGARQPGDERELEVDDRRGEGAAVATARAARSAEAASAEERLEERLRAGDEVLFAEGGRGRQRHA